MDSSVSPKDEIWFLRVCHHISNSVYTVVTSTLLPSGASKMDIPLGRRWTPKELCWTSHNLPLCERFIASPFPRPVGLWFIFAGAAWKAECFKHVRQTDVAAHKNFWRSRFDSTGHVTSLNVLSFEPSAFLMVIRRVLFLRNNSVVMLLNNGKHVSFSSHYFE